MTEPNDTPSGAGSALEIARQHDRERYFCALFARPAARPAVFALLALNHELGSVAEKVSEPLVGQIRLAWWRDAIATIGEGASHPHPLVAELTDACRDGRLDATILSELVEAREAEFAGQLGDDIDLLGEYARLTSGALHRAMLGAVDPSAEIGAARSAEQVGTAWGLVGALRSLPYQVSGGPFTQLAGKERPHLREVTKEIARFAAKLVAEARPAAKAMPRAQFTPFLPAIMTEDYLRRLADAGFDPMEARFGEGIFQRRLAVLAGWARRRI